MTPILSTLLYQADLRMPFLIVGVLAIMPLPVAAARRFRRAGSRGSGSRSAGHAD